MKLSVFESPTSTLYFEGGREIVSLQVLKAFAAFAVVMIHTTFAWRTVFAPVILNAVPLFFMITGYFILNRQGILTLHRLGRSIFKLLKISIVAQCFYIVYSLIVEPSGLDFFREETIKRVICYLTVGHYFGGHLWYLTACLETLIVFYLALRIRIFRYIPILVIIGLCVNLILGCYSEFWMEKPLLRMFSRNALTEGIPFVYLGMLIRRFEHRFMFSQRKILLILGVLYILLYVEFFVILRQENKFGDVIIFTLPTIFFTFVYALRTTFFDKLNWLAYIGREYSLYIYVLHLFVRNVLRMTPYDYTSYEWIEVSILTLFLSVTLRKIIVVIKSAININTYDSKKMKYKKND